MLVFDSENICIFFLSLTFFLVSKLKKEKPKHYFGTREKNDLTCKIKRTRKQATFPSPPGESQKRLSEMDAALNSSPGARGGRTAS